jgi:hypothetical protein
MMIIPGGFGGSSNKVWTGTGIKKGTDAPVWKSVGTPVAVVTL